MNITWCMYFFFFKYPKSCIDIFASKTFLDNILHRPQFTNNIPQNTNTALLKW